MVILNILSIDLQSRTLVIVRNNPPPVISIQEDNLTLINESAEPVGVRRGIQPSIMGIPLALNLAAISYTDGLSLAGDRTGHRIDIVGCAKGLMGDEHIEPKRWADHLLHQAITLDQDRPADDISVLVVAILPCREDDVRYLSARMPF
jgi:serine phosphatase RsbU (regulator of sigma subunit)